MEIVKATAACVRKIQRGESGLPLLEADPSRQLFKRAASRAEKEMSEVMKLKYGRDDAEERWRGEWSV